MIDVSTAASLVLLALADSMSFGTLLIPIWLLAAPGPLRVGRIFVYLATVLIAYLVIGLILTVTLGVAVSAFGSLLESELLLLGQLGLGVALMLVSWAMDTKKARARAAERARTGQGRLLSWRKRIMTDHGGTSSFPLVALAASAVLIELATMLPYLAAIGIISTQAGQWPMPAMLLLGYCLVMVLPAIVLLIARMIGQGLLLPTLERWDLWLTRHAQSTTAWVIGIIGFFLAANAITALGWVGAGSAS